MRDIGLSQKLGQRIFGVESVLVYSTDKSLPHLELKNIKHPVQVKETIHKQGEEIKIARKLRIGELLEDDDSCDHRDEDAEEEMLTE